MDVDRESPWQELDELIAGGDGSRIKAYLDALPPGDAVLAVSRLSHGARSALLTALDAETAARLVEEVPEAEATDLIEGVDPRTAASIIQQLRSDAQADLLGDLDPTGAEAILEEMEPREARLARGLSRYPDDVAGGLMVTEYLAYPAHWSVLDVSRDIRDHAETYRDYQVQYAFVTGADGRLVGVLRLRDLLLSRPERSIAEVMIPDPLTVSDATSLDQLRSFFDHHPFFGVPVISADGMLLGIVRRSAVEEALADRADSDYLKSQGIVGGEELRTMPLLSRSRRRLGWLSVNIGLNVAAATVIAFYQETLASVIALAVFLPIISDMSGCSGNQAVAVSMRELTLGLVRPNETLRVWLKEAGVGLINGAVLGALIAGVAWLWQGNLYLGLVVGIAMGLNTVIAVSIGGVLPLVLRQVRMDPALASGPILTTVTDMVGFFLLLSIASVLLDRLVGG